MALLFVLDDDRDIANIVDIWFSSKGYSVSTFYMSHELMAGMKTTRPDIILLDVLLNGSKTTGLTLCKQIKEETDYPNKVFLFSALNLCQSDIDTSCADGYIPKPFDLEQLYSTVQDAITQPVA